MPTDTAILLLIADLQATIVQQRQRIAELEAQLAETKRADPNSRGECP